MSKLGCIRLMVALSAGLCAGPLFSQTPNKDQTGTNTQAPAESMVPTTPDQAQTPNGGGEEQTQYAVALDGTGLISMDSSAPSHLLFGATVSGGWDSNPDNLGNGVASGVYTLTPYLGVQANTPKAQYLFQYLPTITEFSSSSYAKQSINVASVSIVGSASDRWKWDIKAKGSYGQDSIRFLGSQQTVAVGQVPGTGPNSASYLPNAGTVTSIDGAGEVSYRKSERDSIELRVENAFNRYTSLNESNSTATMNLGYDRRLSALLGVVAYGQSTYYYGSLRCGSYGGGIGLRWQPDERTSLSVSGGPQLSTQACGNQQGFAYSVSLSTRLSGASQIYLLSARQPATSYLGPGLWQDSVSGGYQRKVKVIGTISFDVGYVASNTLTTVSSYRGTYFDCAYGYPLGHGLHASYSYRGYVGDSGGTAVTRNVALFSIAWTSAAGHVFQ
jgi:hypothetical protein